MKNRHQLGQPQPRRRIRLATAGVLLSVLLLCTAAYALTVVWTRTVNGSADDDDWARDVALAPNGDLYVVGHKTVTGLGRNIWIRKYNSNGVTKWTKTVDGPAHNTDSAYGAAVDSTGNLYVVGSITWTGGARRIWIRKYDSSGTKLWTRTVAGPEPGTPAGFESAVDSADNLYVVGVVDTADEQGNIWIRKYDPSGAKLWTRTSDGPNDGDDVAWGVTVDSANNVVVVGEVDLGDEDYEIWVRKYDSSGTKLWTRIVSGPISGWDTAYGVAVDGNDNLFVVGHISTAGEGLNIWIRKYNASGGKLWTRTFNGSADMSDTASGAAVNSDGAVFVIGQKLLSASSKSVWIRKYSPEGVKRWTTTYTGPDDDAWGSAIAVNATSRVYAAGSVLKSGQGDNIWVRKYRQ